MRWSARARARPPRDSFRRKLRAGELNDKEIEIEVQQAGGGMPMFEIPGMPGAQMGAISIGDIFGKLGGGRTKTRRVTVEESHEILLNEESDKLLDSDQLVQEAIKAVEQNGIVFLDEIDKIAGREGRTGADVSREGVQRDLLPLIEGTTVSTKHGSVKTDHILFIASGAFHLSKPSDLLPELQGRLPIRVELRALTRDDFRRILTEPEASLIKQYVALLATEGVTLDFTPDSIDAIADIAVAVNASVENIGARRLQTVMERVLEEISFSAPDRSGETVKIDAAFVRAAHRRSRQERGFEPVYSVVPRFSRSSREGWRRLGKARLRAMPTRTCTRVIVGSSPRYDEASLPTRHFCPPHPHIERALAAVADGGVAEADHQRAEFRQRQPHRHLALEHAALAVGARRPCR